MKEFFNTNETRLVMRDNRDAVQTGVKKTLCKLPCYMRLVRLRKRP